jgi:hypothetical protein
LPKLVGVGTDLDSGRIEVKLFTIGDSISQGFMSAGAAKPQFSYNALLAKALGALDYSFLRWDARYHLKVDLELILRALEERFGSDIRGLEWPFAVKCINEVVDLAEDYYERGPGRLGTPVPEQRRFNSVAVEGMDVADAWLVTPRLCRSVVEDSSNKAARSDTLFGSASDSFYRNAYRVLNPGGLADEQQYGDFSALRWLDHHARGEGVENTIVWLGANNALGTVLRMKISQTPGDGKTTELSRAERQRWNLWHPRDFQVEYHELLQRVDASMRANTANDWKVFVATIPFVTIAPLAKGLGEPRPVDDHDGLKGLYYQYYSYFPFSLETALASRSYLTFKDALHIDRTIAEFNRIIQSEVDALNLAHGGEPRYHVVGIADTLSQLAWKRNKGQPTYELPEELRFIYPALDTKYYDVRPDGHIEGGGIFSLDGIHPTASAHGIIAWEFMKVMQKAGALAPNAKLDWSAILASDTLRTKPIRLLHELYDHDKLVRTVLDAIQLLRD